MRRTAAKARDKGQPLYSHAEVSNRLDGKVGEPRWRGGESGSVIRLSRVYRGGRNYDGFCADDFSFFG